MTHKKISCLLVCFLNDRSGQGWAGPKSGVSLMSYIGAEAHLLEPFFFKDLFLLQSQICRDEERQRGRSSICGLTPQVATVARAELIWSKEAGASSGSSMRMQGPKALGCPLLLFQATGRELDGNWYCWDMNQCPHGIPAHSRWGLLATRLLHWALYFVFKDLFTFFFFWKVRFTES